MTKAMQVKSNPASIKSKTFQQMQEERQENERLLKEEMLKLELEKTQFHGEEPAISPPKDQQFIEFELE